MLHWHVPWAFAVALFGEKTVQLQSVKALSESMQRLPKALGAQSLFFS